jgi:hypothetical protein
VALVLGPTIEKGRSAQRRVGPKAQPMACAIEPKLRVRVILPLCVRYIFELFFAFCMHIIP